MPVYRLLLLLRHRVAAPDPAPPGGRFYTSPDPPAQFRYVS